jgi:hypothetical protein
MKRFTFFIFLISIMILTSCNHNRPYSFDDLRNAGLDGKDSFRIKYADHTYTIKAKEGYKITTINHGDSITIQAKGFQGKGGMCELMVNRTKIYCKRNGCKSTRHCELVDEGNGAKSCVCVANQRPDVNFDSDLGPIIVIVDQ